MFAYQLAISLILLGVLINFIINNLFFKNIAGFELSGALSIKQPLVSVLIPARDEEKNIKRCINSLRKQSYSNIEILVLDDDSKDNTALQVQKICDLDRRVRLIRGKALPRGWVGKSYACWQLGKQAKGEYLLFTDADTLHLSGSVSSSIAALDKEDMDAISVFPFQIMATFHERMVINFINFAFLCFLPIILIKKTNSSLFSAGTGQFILFKKEAYEAIGGHKSVKNRIIEDVAIAKKIKEKGLRFMIYDGSQEIYCRMYNNLKQVVNGFSKFICSAFNYNLPMMFLVICTVLGLFLLPFLYLPLAVIYSWPAGTLNLITSQIIFIMIIKMTLALRFKSRIMDTVFTPVSMLYILSIAISSALEYKRGRGVFWKGRSYGFDSQHEMGVINEKQN